MAEAFLRSFDPHLEVYSAGTFLAARDDIGSRFADLPLKIIAPTALRQFELHHTVSR
jgi:hypothetical protein